MHNTVAMTEANRADSTAPQEKIARQGIDALLEAIYGPGRDLDDFLSWLGLDQKEIAVLNRECLEPYIERFLSSLGTLLTDRRLFYALLSYGLMGHKTLTPDQVGAFFELPLTDIKPLRTIALDNLRRMRHKLEDYALFIAMDLLAGRREVRRWLPGLLSLVQLPRPP